MINENFVILGILIQILGSLKYLIETIQGKIKPNRVTFFLWTLAPLIAFAAQVTQGVGMSSLITFGFGFSPLLILIASFVSKKAYWKLGLFDFTCGFLSVLGLLLWYLTQVGNIAIIFAILADALAALPTMVKAFKYPETEDGWYYMAFAVSIILSLLTIKTWDFAHLGFPVYGLALDLTIFSFAYFKLGKLLKSA
ncbi:MAG: hypothetical protein ACD_38C00072G0007 [uncultured bacterium]|uniref:Uncharacterized protein n=1 Tax=Candidatus Daviesbacteria bacterium GW2011_GWC2_40_12 TaxID=1618431 RepID=A0A0G0T566_9BACT|nr:MAG: hypothetical protein ACD_38C00072G0007 [uncultured bacterium]KKQ84567.1 MAG: hypothetical protein UT04_C0014G0003 [Candidatus Daviesbacteria bacterium GW2011_GWF2_38_7]KKR16381.1 MAG: hypothetical protein UT45_C0006G0056 [Candidatus Daviesbacteria bacterium GW2011_GWA2_39_33]KKR23364.1 MAG: hypothetical protein UT54_C0051G0006 [Candidatus Daviesbacteria bacterium GW2011_GWB1_39_5]KKR42245.1 MAG: hypothetical protein UT77_C0003G0040 [Candidatus Daviesbacteria bacterium GW2011_GWC2_40_12]